MPFVGLRVCLWIHLFFTFGSIPTGKHASTLATSLASTLLAHNHSGIGLYCRRTRLRADRIFCRLVLEEKIIVTNVRYIFCTPNSCCRPIWTRFYFYISIWLTVARDTYSKDLSAKHHRRPAFRDSVATFLSSRILAVYVCVPCSSNRYESVSNRVPCIDKCTSVAARIDTFRFGVIRVFRPSSVHSPK